ncbi:MAG: hypothetical protein PVI21_04185 [Candidatus Woesebacteria bacterium]|jgi:hypothetical protein
MTFEDAMSHDMPKNFNDLVTPADAIAYCKKLIIHYNEYLPKKDKEQLATNIAAIIISDHYSDMVKTYPLFDRIDELGNDLEWSNAIDVDEDWQKLIDVIDQLDKQINGQPAAQ